jgi:hypothetical protein
MKSAIEEWIAASREKLKAGPLGSDDLDRVEALVAESRQLILYLTAQSSNMRSGIIGWVLYDPTKKHEPTLPSDKPPYDSVLDAVADGWRVAQFPISKLYEYKDIENDYVGFDFVLEKWI